jgi:hypothetical protein
VIEQYKKYERRFEKGGKEHDIKNKKGTKQLING